MTTCVALSRSHFAWIINLAWILLTWDSPHPPHWIYLPTYLIIYPGSSHDSTDWPRLRPGMNRAVMVSHQPTKVFTQPVQAKHFFFSSKIGMEMYSTRLGKPQLALRSYLPNCKDCHTAIAPFQFKCSPVPSISHPHQVHYLHSTRDTSHREDTPVLDLLDRTGPDRASKYRLNLTSHVITFPHKWAKT